MGMKAVLFDTNILIYALADKQPYSSFYRSVIEKDAFALSSIVVAEFLSKATPKEAQAMDVLLNTFPVYSVDVKVSLQAAKYRKYYLARRKKIALPDCLIAATCKVHSCALATLNVRDYPMRDVEKVVIKSRRRMSA